MNMIRIMDIEANGLLHPWDDGGSANRIHCVVFMDLTGGIEVATTKEKFIEIVNDSTTLVCHNMLTYDLPLLEKLGWIEEYSVEPDSINGVGMKFVDTLILSRLLDPERLVHGLDGWGRDLGIEKPKIDNWENLSTADYVHRCVEDCKINLALYKYFIQKFKGWDWKEAIRLEKAFQDCTYKSEEFGMYFHADEAEKLWRELDERMAIIEGEVNANLPLRPIPDSRLRYPPKIRFKKDGSPSAHAIRYFDGMLVSNDDGFCVNHPNGTVYDLGDLDIPPVVTHEEMTINNQADLKQHLLNIGWRPEYWNYKQEVNAKGIKVPMQTTPRLNDQQTKDICPNLEKLGELEPWVLKLTEWLVLRHRRNLLRGNGTSGLLNNPRLEFDNRLPAGMVTIGAATSRVTHRIVANLPRVATPYGKEIRSLFGCPGDKRIVGFDASGLEDRLKGHYTFKYDGGEYARKINDPEFDAHTESSELWGISRSDAKTGNYALQFGAGISKFAKGLGVDKEEGEHLYNLWWDNNAGLRDFKNAATHYWEKHGKTFVVGLDGRKVPCDTAHKVVNRIIQSAGAIVMKRATVIFDRLIKKHGLNAYMTEFYHDELVVECDPEIAERVLEIGIKSIKMAGKAFKLNVDLDADGGIGYTWADVH